MVVLSFYCFVRFLTDTGAVQTALVFMSYVLYDWLILQIFCGLQNTDLLQES